VLKGDGQDWRFSADDREKGEWCKIRDAICGKRADPTDRPWYDGCDQELVNVGRVELVWIKDHCR
jgi:hypothetical protein